MSKNKTKPLNQEHAVQEVIFSLQLTEPLSVNAVKRLFSLKDILKNEFPRLEELRQLILQVNPSQQAASILPDATGGAPAGIRLVNILENGSFDWSIHAEQNMLIITCLAYKGWEKTWPRARTYLQTLADQIINANPIKAINLQYTNIFLSSISEQYDLRDVFNENSLYLTDNIKKTGSLWHLFQGWIEENAILKCKYLNNLNLATSIKNKDHVTAVTILRQAQIDNLELDNLDKIMNQLHDDLKKILGNVLAPSMAKEIGLEKS